MINYTDEVFERQNSKPIVQHDAGKITAARLSSGTVRWFHRRDWA
jgi:hypothetical protein